MRNTILVSTLLIILAADSCHAQTNPKPSPAASGSAVEVYYFHMTIRCEACKTVEAEAKKNIELLYPEELKSGKISFTALNLDEASGRALGEKLGVNSQALLIVKGDQKINITNEGFLYAGSKPLKFTEIIKMKIDPLIKKY
jgi:hypothetical protein